MGRVVRREACPKCREAGMDSKGDNLAVYDDGSTYCHAGHGRIGGRMKSEEPEKYPVSGLSLSDCMAFPIAGDAKRKLKPETIKAFNLRAVYDETTGECKRVYYEYTDADHKPTGYKIRNLPKKFSVAGKIQGLYGKQAAFGGKGLFITEGEEDAHAIHSLLLSSTRYAGYDVVSIPNGANIEGKLDAAILADESFIRRYGTVYLALDNDLPGRATRERLAGWLSLFVPNIYLVDFPLKDASECWMAGDLVGMQGGIINAKVFTPDGIINGADISIEDMLRPKPAGFSTPFPDFDNKHKGLRKGEIITICAGSGVGKSTLVKELGFHLVTNHKLKVCHIALENVVEEIAASYVAMYNDVPVPRFMSDPDCIPRAKVEEAMDATVRNMYFFKHFGSIDTKKFQEKLMYYARIGVDFIILDHLSMVISGSEDQNERKQIDKVMTDLATMVVETGVGLINVVHLKRKETGKEKGFNEGGSISLSDLRGSAALEQLSWSVVGLERNQQADDGSEDYSLIRVLKNRTWGFLGKGGRVRYSHETGRMLPVAELTEEVHSVHEEAEVVEAGEAPSTATKEPSSEALSPSGIHSFIEEECLKASS